MGQKESAIASKPVDAEGVKNFVHCTSLRERGLTRSAAKRRHGKVNRVRLYSMHSLSCLTTGTLADVYRLLRLSAHMNGRCCPLPTKYVQAAGLLMQPSTSRP